MADVIAAPQRENTERAQENSLERSNSDVGDPGKDKAWLCVGLWKGTGLPTALVRLRRLIA